MDIPYSRWFSVIEKRRSRRSFEAKQLDRKVLSQLDSICNGFRPFPDARSVLVREVPDLLFKGAIGPYGKIKAHRLSSLLLAIWIVPMYGSGSATLVKALFLRPKH
jgi:hypothetical protein